MGYALAEVAKDLGANVTIISTVENRKCKLDRHISVETAQEMYQQVLQNYQVQDIIIMAAAVADYMPTFIHDDKIKKTADELIVKLTKTPDILSILGSQKNDKILVGFAAETEELEKSAMNKLVRKNVDLIVANDVSNAAIGFSSENNQVSIFDRNGIIVKSKLLPKTEIAKLILNTIAKLDLFKKTIIRKGVDNND